MRLHKGLACETSEERGICWVGADRFVHEGAGSVRAGWLEKVGVRRMGYIGLQGSFDTICSVAEFGLHR
jgi:hypothetical protein